MITDNQRRNQIFRKIGRIPNEKLIELEEFITNMEKTDKNKKKVLSFAGAWKNMEDKIFEDFTTNLINNRKSNRRRFNE